jgi:hypothetical protein
VSTAPHSFPASAAAELHQGDPDEGTQWEGTMKTLPKLRVSSVKRDTHSGKPKQLAASKAAQRAARRNERKLARAAKAPAKKISGVQALARALGGTAGGMKRTRSQRRRDNP